MCIDTGICDGTTKVSMSTLRHRYSILKVLLGQAKIHNIYLAVVIEFANAKVGGLDITMDESTRMDILNAIEHLNQQGYNQIERQMVASFLLDHLQVVSQQFHDYE